ncbi:hypothetical protein [Yinghuangia seranimata]|uniref:hypothetical protein n=1 Tax=Yinghuangia seranimata TaxID=408067 RepID=UPI00248A92E2|nr:hypothetical protein [Yinghuangia seranimata]MDI2126033.1 hypothetical protein [Yinghuangia seranimata]
MSGTTGESGQRAANGGGIYRSSGPWPDPGRALVQALATAPPVTAPPRPTAPPARWPYLPGLEPARPTAAWRPSTGTVPRPVPRPAAAVRSRRWATRTVLRAAVVATALLAAAFAALLARAVVAADDGLEVVGHGAGAQVTEANGLYGALAAMDAELANTLLVGDDTTLGYSRDQARHHYEQDRADAAGALQVSSANAVTDAAADDTARLIRMLAEYDNLAGQIAYADAQADARRLEDPSPAVAQLRRATLLMHDELLPTADRLLAEDSHAVEDAYAQRRADAGLYAGLALTAGILLTLLLVGTQVFLFTRTHRVVNPALLLASIGAMIVVATGTGAVFDARDQLRVAKKDAFDSVLALTHTIALVEDANGDESRWLVDASRHDTYGADYTDKTRQIQALFDREFRNITFAGERDAAQAARDAYDTYRQDDLHLRAIAEHDLRAAMDFTTGYQPGQSNWQYQQVQLGLGAVAALNREHMGKATDSGEHALAGWTVLSVVAAAGLVGAAYAGIRPRLREYRKGA